MPITKKELAQIRGIMHSEVESAVETIAQVVNKAFFGVQKQFDAIDKRVERKLKLQK